MSDMENSQYDVVIVGYGPVGALAANLLGRYGIRTAIIERESTTIWLPPSTRATLDVYGNLTIDL